jgi:hypothetical protein
VATVTHTVETVGGTTTGSLGHVIETPGVGGGSSPIPVIGGEGPGGPPAGGSGGPGATTPTGPTRGAEGPREALATGTPTPAGAASLTGEAPARFPFVTGTPAPGVGGAPAAQAALTSFGQITSVGSFRGLPGWTGLAGVGSSTTPRAAHEGSTAPAPEPLPAPSQPAAPGGIGGSAAAGIALLLTLAGLLMLWVPPALRRLRLASESLRLAPHVLIPERPG